MKNQTVTIKKMGINGEGIAYIDSKIVFIKGALTGEEVLCAIDRNERNYMVGHVVKILKKSSARTHEKNHAKAQYGYSLFHMNYLDQLPYKKGLIKDAISKYTKFNVDALNVKPVLEAKTRENYRQYAGFPIIYRHGQLAFGELEGVESFLSVDDLYRLQDHGINRLLKKVQDILNKHKCKDYYPRVKKGLRYVMVRKFDDAYQLVFVTGKDGIAKEVTQEIAALDEVASIYYTINTSSHSSFNEKGFKRIYGNNRMTYHYDDRDFLFSVKTPMVINPEMEEAYYDVVKSLIPEEAEVLSVYPRYGLLEISLPNTVRALEGDMNCVDDARLNADRLKETNKKFKLGDVDEEIIHFCKKHHYDVALLQLFNDEMSEEIAKSIILSKIPEVIITAKNMSTLGEAIAALQARYTIAYVSGVDMDPNTPLVTGIVKMVRL